jgi:hypothetical protein
MANDDELGEVEQTTRQDEAEAETAAAGHVEPFRQTIKGVEIFRSGTWNNRKYTERDIDDMIKAAAEMGFKPPVKLGHDEDPKAPAYGFVTNLRRDRGTLVADFEDVPDDLVQQIKDKRYDQVSSEIMFDLDRDGKKYRRALRAVAVLGAHVPGVANLRPLSELLSMFSSTDRYETADRFETETATQETVEMTTKTETGADNTAADVAKLQADLEKTRLELATLQTTAADAATLQLKLARLQEREESHTKLFAQWNEERRQQKIDQLVASLDRPIYRNSVAALADLASRAGGDTPLMVKFQASDDVDPTETDAWGVLSDLVRKMNSDVAYLTQDRIRSDPTARMRGGGIDDPGLALMGLVGDYQRAHPGVAHEIAKNAVLGNPKNRDLVERLNAASRASAN